MTLFLSDQAMYSTMYHGLLVVLKDIYVKDLLRKWTAEFQHIISKTHDVFKVDDRESLPCTFSGFNLKLADQENHKNTKDYT